MRARRSRTVRLAGGVLALFWSGSLSAVAQEACQFVDPGNDLLVQQPPFTYVTNPHFRCEGDVEIWADSAVVNSQQSMSLLLGAVRYTDGTRALTATEARYFYEVGRLQAEGRVRVNNSEDGSTVENGDLVYLRQTAYRDVEEMTFTIGDDGLRPKATVFPERAPPVAPVAEDSIGVETDEDQQVVVAETPEPTEEKGTPEPEEYLVVADRIFFRGDSYFDATGDVEITRDSLFAFADSAEYVGELGELLLIGSARVEGSGYELVGRTIALASAADGSDEVRARRDAILTGEDLHVTGPQIVLHLLAGELERMVAVPFGEESDTASVEDAPEEPSPRPLAISGDMELEGDSLDLAAPAGVVERIFAAGSARSVSSTRSELNVDALPELAQHDWIDADTIEVLLVPVGGPATLDGADGSGAGDDYEVDRIIARVGARSLYRLEPADSTAVPGVDPPALSYIVADQITIFMADGQADRVESVGQVSGWHLEPLTTNPAETDDVVAPDSVAAPQGDLDPQVPIGGPDPGGGGDGAPPGA